MEFAARSQLRSLVFDSAELSIDALQNRLSDEACALSVWDMGISRLLLANNTLEPDFIAQSSGRLRGNQSSRQRPTHLTAQPWTAVRRNDGRSLSYKTCLISFFITFPLEGHHNPGKWQLLATGFKASRPVTAFPGLIRNSLPVSLVLIRAIEVLRALPVEASHSRLP
jgi:hypothetical protein